MTLELKRLITFGQYYPQDTFVHRMDPRAKILIALVLILMISTVRAIIPGLLLVALLLIVVRVSRVPVGIVFRALTAVLPILLFFTLIQIYFIGQRTPDDVTYLEWGWLRVTRTALQQVALNFIRIVSFLLIANWPTATTSMARLTHGVDALLRPFQRIGLPASEISLMFMIALQFVPTLVEELDRVIKAQASRLGDLEIRGFMRPDKIARLLLPLVVPLFVNAFRRAEQLAYAMDARGYVGGARRTRYANLTWRWIDSIMLAAIMLAAAAFWLGPWPGVHQWVPGL
jgi:energy-coupling factor transport system permease protein